jgi:hypothetical protein
MTILVILVGLANLVLFIIVLVKLFQEKGVGHGILGIICSLYTFIWGWTKHKELQITNIMAAWSVLIVVSIILNVIMQSQMAGGY